MQNDHTKPQGQFTKPSHSHRTRYAIVGTGSRSHMFSSALLDSHASHGELVAVCDNNQQRMDYYNQEFAKNHQSPPIPTYQPNDFERMIREQRVDTVIVTSIDRTHHLYITRAMYAGCDVISEKPMTTEIQSCREIFLAQEKTGKSLRVTFNYRYAPRNSRVKELLQDGVIGNITSVHFEWLLNTKHGADYFRRWHRDKRNSGGLMVHKATHHFDLVNWWLAAKPISVFGIGSLAFYGRKNAEARGVDFFYDRGTGNADKDPFALDLAHQEKLRHLYLEAEHIDGYRRDQSVFGDGISIEDDMSVLVQYNTGAHMTYHLNAFAPWEGYRIAFNGTKGRLEYDVEEKPYVSGDDNDSNRPDIREAVEHHIEEPATLLIRPHWQQPMAIP